MTDQNTPYPQNPQGGQPAPQYGQPGQAAPQYGQPGEGSRFGTQAYGAPGLQYGAPLAEPATFRTLLKLTLASAVVYVLSALPGLFVDQDALVRDQLRAQGKSAEQIDQAMQNAGMVSAMAGIGLVVWLLIALGLYALVYFGLRARKNWARVLGIVLAILGTLSAVFGLFRLGSFPAGVMIASLVLSVLFIAVNVLWLVNAFNKDVAAYTQQGRLPAA
ncbi:hypothetical protein [Micrococcus porci]|uniref:hypothetical protein n=1 Tax=Micrococcus porci TaxID=2856555 RepID=UPI003CED0A64